MAIIQQPDALSLSGNLKKIIVSSGSTVSFILKDGATVLIDATYDPGTDGRVTIDVKDIVESRLSFLLSGQNFYEQSAIVKTFTAVIDGASVSFKAIRAGVANLADTPANWLKQNFLTWQPASKPVTYYSPEWLTYYAVEACNMKLKAYFSDKTEQTVTIGSCGVGKAFTANVQYAVVAGLLGQKYPLYFDVWAETTSGTRLSYLQRYYFSEIKSEQEQWFLFENSLGGIDTLRASGDTDFEGAHEHKIASIDGTSSEYRIDTERFYNKNTGHLDEYERRWLLDFFPSRSKLVHFNGAFRKVVVSESDVKYAASDLPSSYNFRYRFADDSSALLNLIRNEDAIPENITIPNIDSPDFILPPRLSEFPRVTLSEGVILPAFDPFSETPKTTTIGAIATAIIQQALTQVPGSGNGGTMVQVLGEDGVLEPTNQNVFSALRVLAEIAKAIENAEFDEKYLSKVNPDTAQGLIKFISGIEVGDFVSGLLGSGAALKNNNGVTSLEVDRLLVRMRAEFFSIMVHNAKHVGGQQITSAANMICIKVEETTDFYRCYFDTGKNNEVVNLFENTDRARCQVFTGSGQKFYWRKVVAVGPDYIELSKTDMSPGVNDAPAAGDHIYQLGSDNPERQSAIITSSVGPDAPSFIQYAGINGYDLTGKETTKFTRLGNRISGKTVFVSDNYNLDDWATGTSQDIQNAQSAANEAALAAQQAIDDAEANVTLINTEVGKLQAQIDGEVSNWFYPYSPTLANYPASGWTTNAIKDRHVGDTFTNTAQAPAADAGKSWRFVKNGTVYSWTPIADSDAVLALQRAAQAQATADGKSTTYLVQPTSYKFGDSWTLATDRTVNGETYKSGEILNATQDSTTFVESHWIKKVRYTDDSAVNNLQIGGRNLLLNSNVQLWQDAGVYKIGGYRTSKPLERGKTYTLVFFSGYGGAPHASGIMAYIHEWQLVATNSEQNEIKVATFTVPDRADLADDPYYHEIQFYNATGQAGIVTWAALYEGDVKPPMVHIEAPEDVQARIAEAKQAGVDAQTALGETNTTVNALNSEWGNVTKDDIISQAETQSLDALKKKIIDSRDSTLAEYNRVYTNTYLEGTAKTNLLNSKTTFAGAVDALLTSLTNAISDGKTTVAEKTDVNNKFNSYNSASTDLSDKLSLAQIAIEEKLKGYSDAALQAADAAKEAAQNAQNSANTANQAVSTLNGYVDGAFKDGLIDSSEAKAIEKYINVVNSEKAGLEATYNKLYVNTYLEGTPKSDLLNAKVTYFGAVDALLASINTAISDGKTTVAEKADVDSKYSSYKTALASLQSAIEEANKAIQTKIDQLSTDKVDNLQIGARNLLLNSNVQLWQPAGVYHIGTYRTSKPLERGKTYTIVYFSGYGGAPHASGIMAYIHEWQLVATNSEQNEIKVATFTVPDRADLADDPYYHEIQFYNATGQAGIVTWAALYEGDVKPPMVHIEAPEDVQARIDAEKTRINEILSDNIADPSEKQYLANLWQEIYAEYPRIWAQANTYVVDKSNYEAKYTALNNLLSPVLANLTVNTTVSGASIRTAFNQYYDARAVLVNAVTNAVNAKAVAATATANEAAAKTQFQTLIEGGLVYTALMKLIDVATKTETAGISGQPGGGELPAFWAGGTYAEAIQGLAKAIIRHDGRSKFTDTEIEGIIKAASGEIGKLIIGLNKALYMTDKDNPNLIRYELSDEPLPLLQNLLNNAVSTKEVNNTLKNFTNPEIFIYPNSITVDENGSEFTVTGSMSAQIDGWDVAGEVNANAHLNVELITSTGEVYAGVGSIILTYPGRVSDMYDISTKIYGVPKGTYRLRAGFIWSAHSNPPGVVTASGYISGLQMTVRFEADRKQMLIGKDGFMSYYGIDKFFYLNSNPYSGLPFLSFRGEVDMPGVLATGSVALAGGFENTWGPKKVTGAQRVSLGRYRVYHDVGHSFYRFNVLPDPMYISGTAHSVTASKLARTSTYFEILLMKGENTLVDVNFDFTIYGRNYV